jgi:non-homologous end joining protein Ku
VSRSLAGTETIAPPFIEAKQKGETITAAPAEEEDEAPGDLLAALKASVDAGKSKASVRAKRPPARTKAAARRKKTAKR